MKLNPENYQQVLSSNFLYEGGFVLPPGKYKLKAVVRENESGKMGTFEEPLVLPQIGQSGLALSSWSRAPRERSSMRTSSWTFPGVIDRRGP